MAHTLHLIDKLKSITHRLLCFFLLVWIAFGCIPNKKVIYLQKNDVNKKDLKMDSIVRKYPLQEFDYKIQPNDVLNIKFGSLTDDKFDFLNKMQQDVNASGGGSSGGAQGAGMIVNGYLVDPQGNISFPVVGSVHIAGLNVFEAQEYLQSLANQYLEATTVRVKLVNFRFTVLGEVMTEGTTVAYNNRVTLLEALGLAGGLGEFADRSKIKVVRTHGENIEVAYINLLDENFINSPYYFMNQNDVLIVPPLKQRQFRKYFGQNIALILATISLAAVILSLYQK